MLSRLLIKNLLLVQSADVQFQPGFTIITGESGAGKSVLASAILLLLGAKVDSALIRKPAVSAYVEAGFYPLPDTVLELLQQAGISSEADEELIISREIFTSGKSKSFVNNQAASASLLKKIAPYLVSFCSQHAQLELFSGEAFTALLDRFAHLVDTKKEFQRIFATRVALQNEIQLKTSSKRDRESLFEIATHQITEIDSLHLQAGEDDALYARFSELNSAIELADTVSEITKQLEISCLTRLKPLFDKLVKQSSRTQPIYEAFTAILCELSELTYALSRGSQCVDMSEIAALQDRLSLIDSIKKKFGKTIEEILQFKQERKSVLAQLEMQEVELEELNLRLQDLQEQENSLAKKLSDERKEAAPKLSKLITDELQSLNMASSIFALELEQCARSTLGDEKVACYIQVNKGLDRANLLDAASGGELSRIILACRTVLLADDDPTCLIFDEIDANIGGQTASIVGQKLLSLSVDRQVLAITHFPQVAASASHHFLIMKQEIEGSTYTSIQSLVSKEDREQEFCRMLGGERWS